jgi:hypothetical protein
MKTTGPRRRRAARAIGAAICAVAALTLSASAALADPIASSGPAPSLPAFSGQAAVNHPIKERSNPPQNPFMAANPFSNIHNDTWMTDSYAYRGPLGRSPSALSAAKPPRICGSLAFDSHGQIVSVCPSLFAGPQARIMDADSLETIATYDLPDAANPPGTKLYQNFTGGGYFFLDNRDRMWVSTKTDHIFVLAESADGRSLSLQRDYDLTSVLDESSERISSALPDFSGRIWFVSKQSGKVGTLDRRTGNLRVKNLHEEIENSFAVGRDGVYIVSDKRMYRFTAGADGTPRIVWKAGYKNSGIVKPGQVDAGSGTTPTVMPGGYVAITDNAEPMNVVVYRTAAKLHRGERRTVCEVPVFGKHTGDTENSLLGAGRSLIVENNYGYQDPLGPNTGAVTKPGFARVDLDRDGKGCHKVWTNHEVRAPTVVPKLSTRTGLIYTYTRPLDPSGSEGYYWTAIDFRNGKTAWNQYAGSGLNYNNNYAGLALGPDGTAYLGVIGGLVALRDGR